MVTISNIVVTQLYDSDLFKLKGSNVTKEWLIDVLDDLEKYCIENGDQHRLVKLQEIRRIYHSELACRRGAEKVFIKRGMAS